MNTIKTTKVNWKRNKNTYGNKYKIIYYILQPKMTITVLCMIIINNIHKRHDYQ
jgi:hypothetical protein